MPIGLPASAETGRHVYHLFVITTDDRDRLHADLTAKGIETGIHYPVPVYLLPAAPRSGYRACAIPNAEHLADHSLSLPMYPELPLHQLERVADTIRSHYGALASGSGHPFRLSRRVEEGAVRTQPALPFGPTDSYRIP